MTDTQSALLPDELPSATAEDIKRASSYPTLRTDVAMRFIVKEVERSVSEKTGSVALILGVRPLTKDNKPVYPGTRLRLTCPFRNPKAVGLKYENTAPDTLRQWHRFFNALYPDTFPHMPKKVGNAWVTDGGAGSETLATKEDNEAMRQKINAQVFERIQAYWKNPNGLLEEVFIAQPTEDKDEATGNVYTQLDAFRTWSVEAPPQDVTVVTEKFAE